MSAGWPLFIQGQDLRHPTFRHPLESIVAEETGSLPDAGSMQLHPELVVGHEKAERRLGVYEKRLIVRSRIAVPVEDIGPDRPEDVLRIILRVAKIATDGAAGGGLQSSPPGSEDPNPGFEVRRTCESAPHGNW
jgi:hypothetical protein